VQEPHDEPAPAIMPLLPMAENKEIIRRVLSLLHLGQAMSVSASDIERKASKPLSQSVHLYSYSGINSPSFYVFDFTGAFYRRLASLSRLSTISIAIVFAISRYAPHLPYLGENIQHTI